MESQAHEHSLFSTFTYEVMPNDSSVHKVHLTRTIHRLRDRCRDIGKTIRFFGVGEYGENTGRPHYHAVIFGIGVEVSSLVDVSWQAHADADESRPGFCSHFPLSSDAASYVAGYTTKKLTSSSDARLGGRQPEFAVMSRRPGIGMLWVQSLVDGLNTSEGALYMARYKDVPVAFQIDGKLMPLGSHIRRYLRQYFFGDPAQPKEAKEANERRFYEENMPFVPSDASPTLRKIIASECAEQVASSHATYFGELIQRGKNRASRHAIKQSMRTL